MVNYRYGGHHWKPLLLVNGKLHTSDAQLKQLESMGEPQIQRVIPTKEGDQSFCEFPQSSDVSVMSEFSDSNSESTKKKRIRPKKPSVAKPPPLVPKNDIRRSYASMIVNVINSCDFPLMFGFLETFVAPNALYNEIFFDNTISFTGMNYLSVFFARSVVMWPDIVLKLKDCQVNCTTGRITATVEMTITRLYDDEDLYSESLIEDVNNSDLGEQSVKKARDGVSQNIRRLMGEADAYASKLMPRKEPDLLVSLGVFTIDCDEEKRIVAMDIVTNENLNGTITD